MKDFNLFDVSSEVRFISNEIAYNGDNWEADSEYTDGVERFLIIGPKDLEISIDIHRLVSFQVFYKSSHLNNSEAYLLYKSVLVMNRTEALRIRDLKLNSMRAALL